MAETNRTFFPDYASYFPTIANSIEERVNGKKTEATYLHKEMLTEDMSTDLKWETLFLNRSIVASDIVSMDSSLPLKKRDSWRTASGDIPKTGMKFKLTEKQMSDIKTMLLKKVPESVIVEKIFNDEIRAIMGIHERNELMFLQAISTGVALADDADNVGTGVRVDYGYQDSNKYGAVVPWTDSENAKPLDDIKRVIKNAKANGDVIKYLMMSDTAFDRLAECKQTKEQYAFAQNFVGTTVPTPDMDQVNALMKKKFGLMIIVVDRTVTTERDGERTVHTPFAEDNVVFLTTNKVGKIQYGMLAEESMKSKQVDYAKSGSYILLKKWSDSEPFAEYTSSQALVIPVIDNVSSIYLLDSEEAAVDVQTEGDANFDYEGTSYTRTSVIAAINLATGKTTAKANNTDATLLKYVNELSDEQILVFEANIVEAV